MNRAVQVERGRECVWISARYFTQLTDEHENGCDGFENAAAVEPKSFEKGTQARGQTIGSRIEGGPGSGMQSGTQIVWKQGLRYELALSTALTTGAAECPAHYLHLSDSEYCSLQIPGMSHV